MDNFIMSLLWGSTDQHTRRMPLHRTELCLLQLLSLIGQSNLVVMHYENINSNQVTFCLCHKSPHFWSIVHFYLFCIIF
jgi:hypothetical protein